jgi:hypothetical protein
MAPERDRGWRETEARGFLPRRAGELGASWRRLKAWLFGDREGIAQEGLLAGRTLLLAPRRSRHDEAEDEPRGGASAPPPPPDEAR